MLNGDLLITGSVFTGRRYVGAIVAREGKIVFSGSRKDAEEHWDCEARIDHGDGLVLPGLIDSHMHLSHTGISLLSADLKGSASIGEMTGRVRQIVETQGFAVATGWDQEMFMEKRYPVAADLDSISPDRPMILYRFCTHVAVVNSKVLQLTGVGSSTPDPPGGIVGRDQNGIPNGLFFDTAIEKYIYPIEGELTKSMLSESLRVAMDHAVSLGLTTLMPVNVDMDELNELLHLKSAAGLKCRLRIFLSADAFKRTGDRAYRSDDDMLKVCGIKLFADGAFGTRTALLSEPYDDMDTRGLALMEQSEMEGLMRKASAKGLIVAVHAIGDRAVENALLAASGLKLTSPWIRVEHAALTPEGVRKKLSEVKPTMVVQPHFLVGDWWLPKRLGRRCSDCYLFRTFTEMGLAVAGSSDSPVEPLNPWSGILSAIDRGRHSGTEMAGITAHEALLPEDALRMYTVNGGQASGEAGKLGMLEVGSFADAVFLGEREFNEVTAASPKLLATMVGGRIVYSSDQFKR